MAGPAHGSGLAVDGLPAAVGFCRCGLARWLGRSALLRGSGRRNGSIDDYGLVLAALTVGRRRRLCGSSNVLLCAAVAATALATGGRFTPTVVAAAVGLVVAVRLGKLC